MRHGEASTPSLPVTAPCVLHPPSDMEAVIHLTTVATFRVLANETCVATGVTLNRTSSETGTVAVLP